MNQDSGSNSNPLGNGGGENTLPPLCPEIRVHRDMSLLPQRSNLASASASIGHNVPLPQFSVTGSSSVRPYGNTLPPLSPSSTAVPVALHDMSMAMRSDLVSVNDNNIKDKTSPVISADGKDQVLISGELFTAWQVKQLEGDAKLFQMALNDPKRVKKILANRVCSIRQKEKKEQHLIELDNKCQTLQAENAKMCTQISNFQIVCTQLEKDNKELEDRVQYLEHQEQLGEDDTKRLTAEVNRLKIAAGEVSQEYPREAESSNMQPQNATTSQQQLNDALQEIERNLNSVIETDVQSNLDFFNFE